jgi:hypothetical protein
MHKANWEIKSAIQTEKIDANRKITQFKDQRRKFLDIRRAKLSELLNNEEEGYRQEIASLQETPEQVRNKMEQKLFALKEEKERERQNLVKELQDRKFKESADELRKNDSEAFAIACYLEQENQMLDKLKKLEEERKKEELYVILNNLDNQKKCKS